MKKQTLYSMLLVGLITSCAGAEDAADFDDSNDTDTNTPRYDSKELIRDFRTNSRSVSWVTTLPTYRLELEVVPNEDLYGDLTFKWSTTQPDAGMLKADSPFSVISAGRTPGRFRAECEVTGTDMSGTTITKKFGVDFEVIEIDPARIRKLLTAVLINGFPRDSYATSTIPRGSTIDVEVQTADGASEVDVDIKTSLGELTTIEPQRYTWILPESGEPILDLRVTGKLDGGETNEPYVHVFRME
jgi:hypothetical protein